MSLRDQRVLFSKLLSELVLWIGQQPGLEVAYDEVTVHSPRAARQGVARIIVEDAVHKRDSFHHSGIGADLLVFRDGIYVASGDDPVWLEIARKWETMDPACTSGIRWKDANHVSLGEGSKQPPL